MGNVIYLLNSQGTDPMTGTAEIDSRPGEIRRQAEFREIHNAIDKTPTFKSAQDVKIAATNLTEMLREAKKLKGVTRAEIARVVWPRDVNPSKRFDRLTLPLGSVSVERRIDRLQKRTSHYRKVAVELAKLTQAWLEPTLVRLFGNTSVDRQLSAIIQGRDAKLDDPDYCWQNLTEMLESLVNSMSEKVDLRGHLIRIGHMGGRYDLSLNEIIPSSLDLVSGGDRLLPHGPLGDEFARWDHFPPIPSIPIVDELLVPPFRSVITATATKSDRTASLDVEVRVWRELRLAIGPVDTIDRAGPLFEVRTRVDLAHETKQIKLARPWIYVDFPEEVRIFIDGEEHIAELDFDSQAPEGTSWYDFRLWRDVRVKGNNGEIRHFELPPEHNCAAWRRVTSELCEELFHRPKLNDATPEFAVYFRTPAQEPTLAPEGTLGATVEIALRKPESLFVSTLLEEAQRIVSLVKEEQMRRHVEANILNDQAVTSWSEK